MAVKIRLQRRGKKKQPFYHIVIADARSPRDGRFIEKIGSYNPLTSPATIDLDREKAFEWLGKGAQPTDTVRAIMRFKGIMFRKHVMNGVKKGLFTEEEAMAKYNDFVVTKDAKIEARVEKSRKEKAAARAKIAGINVEATTKAASVPKVVAAAKPVEVEEPVVEEATSQEEE